MIPNSFIFACVSESWLIYTGFGWLALIQVASSPVFGSSLKVGLRYVPYVFTLKLRLRGQLFLRTVLMLTTEMQEGKLNCTNRFQAFPCIVSNNILLAKENHKALHNKEKYILRLMKGTMKSHGRRCVCRQRWRTGANKSIYHTVYK